MMLKIFNYYNQALEMRSISNFFLTSNGMSWSSRKRTLYILLFILAVVIIVGIPTYLLVYDSPTCFDGKKNGGEEAIDCGGKCERVCEFETISPIVHWSRFFEIADGVYNAVALVENPNFDVSAEDVPYVFVFRDKDNRLVYERKGVTNIPSKKIFPVFESEIQVGERPPVRSRFEFSATPKWIKSEPKELGISFGERSLSMEDSTPRLDATIVNNELFDIRDVFVVAIIYDEDDNAIGVSRTFVPVLLAESSVEIVFTWQKPFESEVRRITLTPLVEEE